MPSVNSFSLDEVNLLVLTLKKKFDLNCTIQNVYLKDTDVISKDKKKYVKKDKGVRHSRHSIYIRSNSLLTLKNLVAPHMPESMLYKLGL